MPLHASRLRERGYNQALELARGITRHLAIDIDWRCATRLRATAVDPDRPEVLRAANQFPRVEIRGLMTMPPAFEELEKVRPFFRRLRELRDGWEKETGVSLPELSMGMSHDFEIAIEEGAHWVRVGTAIFGPRNR